MSRRKPLDEEAARALGSRLREARGDRTQADFAPLLGIDRATLANYESGRRIPNDEILKRYQEATGRQAQELFFGISATPFEEYIERFGRIIAAEQAKRPGFIPKFTISDDEMALIKTFRLASMNGSDTRASAALDLLITSALDAIASSADGSVSEGSVDRLREALARGHLEQGFDPDTALFHSPDAERWVRRHRVRNRVRNPDDDASPTDTGLANAP